MGILDPKSLNVSLESHHCDYEFGKEQNEHIRSVHEGANLKKIFDLKLQERNLEKKIDNQKLRLTSTIFKLREREYLEKDSCNCKRFCRIFHQKHNWKKSPSHVLIARLDHLSM